MPPYGSGSGMPGGGYGSECASGFPKVCPEMDGACPMDSMPVCPAPMTMPFVRSLDRMVGQMGSSDGCECVPMVLMQMVMTQQEVMGRSLDRAAITDTFEDESVKVGKKTCTCEFVFVVNNGKVKKATGACDKKCSGAVKKMSLNSPDYAYTFGFSSKKGKVKMGKVSAVGGSAGGSGGSGMPGGSAPRRARSRWARFLLLGDLLEGLEDLECQEDQGRQEVQGCREAVTGVLDVFASICPATWGLEALGCPQCHQLDLDQELVAMEQVQPGEATQGPRATLRHGSEVLATLLLMCTRGSNLLMRPGDFVAHVHE